MSQVPKFTLNDGNQIPAVAVGTWELRGEDGYKSVLEALKIGYRHIDTATMYNNEEIVGRAIRDSGVPREEIFVTTKLAQEDHRHPAKALDESLERLGLDYVDLYLMHWPLPEIDGKPDPEWTFVQTWEQIQKLKGARAKSIGVSNVSTVNFEKLLQAPTTTITPAVNQVELHPLCQQDKLLAYCKDKGIVCTAYCPLARGDRLTINVIDHPVVKDIAAKYNTTPGTAVLSWGIWRGTPVLPKSANPERLKSNLAVVELSDDDARKISAIGAGKVERIVQDPGLKRGEPVAVFHDDAN